MQPHQTMITQLPQSKDSLLGFKMSGKLHHEDYQHFVPTVEAAIAKFGKVRILSLFEDFHGWDMHALWDDTVFATKHCTEVARVALVSATSLVNTATTQTPR